MLPVSGLSRYRSRKIVPFNKAKKLISGFKSKKRKVGLCHGGFDVLHAGHIRHFESSKKLCDVLFVSITSDRFVAERKGGSRPVFTDRIRAYAVSAVEFVDYVIIADFSTAIEVIKSLKPDYYIKGPDYINRKSAGIERERAAIKSVGGRIIYTRDPKLSTTGIIGYLKRQDG